MMSIEKIVEPIEGERVTFVDQEFEGKLEAEVDGGDARVLLATIDGATTWRIPLAHLSRICSLLSAIHADPEVPTDSPPPVEQ